MEENTTRMLYFKKDKTVSNFIMSPARYVPSARYRWNHIVITDN